MNKREVEAVIAEFGGNVVDLVCNNHWKATCRFGDRMLKVILPVSESDYRAIKNIKTSLKRRLKNGR
jgi:hypothetical protein